MYKVLKISESLATRTVELENEITGNKVICFDDSALVSMNNFEFIKEGECYECFIKLFGEISDKSNSKAIMCKIVSKEVIGNKNFFKVSVDKEIYFVPEDKVKNVIKDDFWFAFTRKDLIKVNDIIHSDLLNE